VCEWIHRSSSNLLQSSPDDSEDVLLVLAKRSPAQWTRHSARGTGPLGPDALPGVLALIEKLRAGNDSRRCCGARPVVPKVFDFGISVAGAKSGR
jgi:hypothetical protein